VVGLGAEKGTKVAPNRMVAPLESDEQDKGLDRAALAIMVAGVGATWAQGGGGIVYPFTASVIFF